MPPERGGELGGGQPKQLKTHSMPRLLCNIQANTLYIYTFFKTLPVYFFFCQLLAFVSPTSGNAPLLSAHV